MTLLYNLTFLVLTLISYALLGKELSTGITQRKYGRYSAKFKSKSGNQWKCGCLLSKNSEKMFEAQKYIR